MFDQLRKRSQIGPFRGLLTQTGRQKVPRDRELLLCCPISSRGEGGSWLGLPGSHAWLLRPLWTCLWFIDHLIVRKDSEVPSQAIVTFLYCCFSNLPCRLLFSVAHVHLLCFTQACYTCDRVRRKKIKKRRVGGDGRMAGTTQTLESKESNEMNKVKRKKI